MLIEREQLLDRLAEAAAHARGGRGRLVFVSGEAGAGKTALAAAAARRAGLPVGRGVCDSVTTAAGLGVLVDARPDLADLVVGAGRIFELSRAVRDRLSAAPGLLVLDDLHWADEASLDVVRFLGRRLEGLPLLLVATYRPEELDPGHRLTAVLGQLTGAPGVLRMSVPPLTHAAVARLVASAGSGLDPAALHARTGGNAFYLGEVLAANGAALPDSVRDAVLARVGRVGEAAQQVLAAAAVLGRAADTELLLLVAASVATALDECAQSGLLVDRDGWAIRHEIAREVVAAGIRPAQRRELHARALAALSDRGGEEDARLARHAAEAGDRARAHRFALRAADRAARLGAHHEAAIQLRLALRFADLPSAGRAALLRRLSYECYLTDELEEALAARLRAFDATSGEATQLGDDQRWLSRLSWFLGRGADAVRYAERAVATLAPGGPSVELGMAYSNRSQLCMNGGDVDGALDWGRRAIDVSREVGEPDIEIHALNNIGTAQAERDFSFEGRELLQRSLSLALAADAHEHVARAYTNLGSSAVNTRHLAEAAEALRAGIAYCTERDLDSWTLYMDADRCRLRADQGEFDLAAAEVAQILAQPRLAPVTAIVALCVDAQLTARRGGDPGPVLTRAAELAVGAAEVQRLVPVAAVTAEAAWLADTWSADAVRLLDLAWTAAVARELPWEVGEIAWWRRLAGLDVRTTVAPAAPFAALLGERWADAAGLWAERGCVLWQALSLAHCPDLDSARIAVGMVERLGASAVLQAFLRDRYRAGLPVPRGPRPATRDHPSALTAREVQVLELLARGLSNADIGRELFLTEKTVGHHVSAVLRKLDQPSRSRAVAAARQSGLLGGSPR